MQLTNGLSQIFSLFDFFKLLWIFVIIIIYFGEIIVYTDCGEKMSSLDIDISTNTTKFYLRHVGS